MDEISHLSSLFCFLWTDLFTEYEWESGRRIKKISFWPSAKNASEKVEFNKLRETSLGHRKRYFYSKQSSLLSALSTAQKIILMRFWLILITSLIISTWGNCEQSDKMCVTKSTRMNEGGRRVCGQCFNLFPSTAATRHYLNENIIDFYSIMNKQRQRKFEHIFISLSSSLSHEL